MIQSESDLILTVNGGSSSIKVSLAASTAAYAPLFAAELDRVGTAGASLTVRASATVPTQVQHLPDATFETALGAIVDGLKQRIGTARVAGIGHRVVHGGLSLLEHQLVTPAVLAMLKEALPLDLAHLPREMALMEGFGRAFEGVPQVACFDTVFHRDMPRVAQLLPIARRYFRAGLRRFGFHGLSYTSLMQQLAAMAGPEVAAGRVILAHLGAGASMAAVRGGKPIDTTMSFTPLSGLVMATRPGDLDPGLLVYLIATGGVGKGESRPRALAERLDQLLSTQCGLLGVSEVSGDMRDLFACRGTSEQAAEAIELFCYQARKHLSALAGAMGGVDTIVFSGGIGEHSAAVRAAICDGLEFLGVRLDDAANASALGVISAVDSHVSVRTMRTDEERVIVGIVRGVVVG